MKQDFFEHNILIKKLGRDTLTYIPAKLIPGSITVLSIAIFTRIFSPAEYGMYILITTTTTILSAIFSQWIMQSILRYRTEYISKGKMIFFNKNIYILLCLITVVIIIIGAGLFAFNSFLGIYRRFFMISVFIVVTQIWFDNLTTIYQADLKSITFTIYTILNSLFKFGGALIIIIFLRDISALLWSIALANLLFSVPLVIQLMYSSSIHVNKINQPDYIQLGNDPFYSFTKKLFNYGLPMVGWFLGAQLLNVADRYFLQIFRSSEEVGIYSSNYNLVASAISFISMPLLTAAHPLLMSLGASISDKKQAAQELIKSFSRYFLIIVFPVMTYVLIFSKEIVAIFLGNEYRQGNVVLPIILFGLMGWYFAMFGHKGLEFREKTYIMFIYVMICTVMKIILNIIFIPPYGYWGAAFSTLICFFLYPVLVFFGTRKDIRWIIPWSSIVKISLVCIILAVIFLLMRMIKIGPFSILLISGIIIIPLYLIMLILIKEIKVREIRYAQVFIQKIIERKRRNP